MAWRNPEVAKEYMKRYNEEHKEYNRKYYQDHKAHQDEYHKQWVKENGNNNKEFVRKWKQEHPCTVCGEKDFRCLCFHHINPDEKEDNVAHLAEIGNGCSFKRLKKEMDKCVILCQNCHAKMNYDKKHPETM